MELDQQQQQQQQQLAVRGFQQDMDAAMDVDQQQPAGGGFQQERDTSMELTDDERQRAIAIKAAVESSEHIKPLPDFEYGYLAIACSGKSLAQILDVAYKMQCFREMYKVTNNPQEGTAMVAGFLELQPGHLLDVSYLPHEHCFTTSGDYAALQPSLVKTDAQWEIFFGGWYYILRATMTNFQAIRNGTIILSECEGMGFSNFDYSFVERLMVDFLSYFPIKNKETYWLNTPTVANMCYGMGKRILSKEFMDSWKMGGGLEGYDGRLSDLYNMPTPEIAQQDLLNRIEVYLWQWHHNEQNFSLTR